MQELFTMLHTQQRCDYHRGKGQEVLRKGTDYEEDYPCKSTRYQEQS